jgi:DNA-directed RNA polymerase specialized sigma24 family protein
VPVREVDLDRAMARLAGGDRSAFEALYISLRPRALRLAQMRVGAADAPDVAQAALLKVFARASEFSPGRPCLPWFYAIVANEVRASRRRGSRFVLDAAAGNDVACDDADAETKLVSRELERALELAISALDDDAAGAIAAILGRGPLPKMHAATIRKRVSRAYAKLRLLLGGRDVG